MSFNDWEYCMCLVIHHCNGEGVNAIHDFTGRGKLEAVQVELFWTLLFTSLPLADVNLYAFVVINYNGEYNGFQ